MCCSANFSSYDLLDFLFFTWMVLCKAGVLSQFRFYFISHDQKDGWLNCAKCQGADGHEGRPHTPLCVLLWFRVTCCKRQVLEVEGTGDDSCCDHCSFATTKHTIPGFKIITTTKQKIAWYWVCARTLRWCVPGQVSAEQSRLCPSSHHMDWNCSQEHRAGRMEGGDRGMRTVGGKHVRWAEWWKGKGGEI